MKLVFLWLILISLRSIFGVNQIEVNTHRKKLYDDLLSNYNRLIPPVTDKSDILTVGLRLKPSKLMEVKVKNQVVITNLWVEQIWFDYNLQWKPKDYGGVEMLYVPSERIWLPDIVLYNNWDGNYEVTLLTNATLKYNGEVTWEPAVILKSSYEINDENFLYDEQTCIMKFGSQTHNGVQLNLMYLDGSPTSYLVSMGMHLRGLYLLFEWDILEVPEMPVPGNEEYYQCYPEPDSNVTFRFLKRKVTLCDTQTAKLILSCLASAVAMALIYYKPYNSGEKILIISIIVTQTVIFLSVVAAAPRSFLY